MRLTQAEIHLRALQHNYDGIRKRVGPNVKIMGVVKANAYGHGSREIAKALVGFGCEYLGVAFLEEAVELREAGITIPILVLTGAYGYDIRKFFDYNLDITVASVEMAEFVDREAVRKGNTKARVHLKIDTGMERIGVRAEHAVEFVKKVHCLQQIELIGIYSHFATSDETDKAFAYEQLRRFQALIDQLEAAGIRIPLKHIANSGAVLDMPESYFSMVRPGIMLYGYYPSRETSESISLQPVLSLRSKIHFLKEVNAQTSISYGRTYTTSSKTKIATVPAGYADGYSRRLTNRGEVLIKGKRFPVAGTICMDQLMIDVGTEANVNVGDDVTLLGSDSNETISAWDIADMLGTIPYEILSGIAARVPRVVNK
jgi:alanine racemase